MKSKQIEIAALLRTVHKKSGIANHLKVSRRILRRVADRLTNRESLKGRARSGRPRTMDSLAINTDFLKNPKFKITETSKKRFL